MCGVLTLAQSCLRESVDCSPPGSSVHGVFPARILEWVSISLSKGSSRPRDQTFVSMSPALQADSLPLAPPEKPLNREDFCEGRSVRSIAAGRQTAPGKPPISFRVLRVMGDLSWVTQLGDLRMGDTVKVKTRLEWVGAGMGGEETETTLSQGLPGV